jgi:hypothetical protein
MSKTNINIATALYVETIHPEDPHMQVCEAMPLHLAHMYVCEAMPLHLAHMYVCEAMPLHLAHPNPSSVLDLIDVPI